MTRELLRTWTKNGVLYHEAFGKCTTVWVSCPECGKRQPAGTETLTAYGGEPFTRVERLSNQWAKPEIGRCSVCYARGPLVEINLYQFHEPTHPLSVCTRTCLEAKGDQCDCWCLGRDHGAGVCTCKEAGRNEN